MPLQVQFLLTITWIIDRVIRYYRGIPWDGGTNIRRLDTINQSNIHNVELRSRKKRKKNHAFLYLKLEYVDTITSWLRDDNVITIGIHGMGGVGKTTLSIELYNRVLQHDMFVAWVSIGEDFTIYELQEKISDAFRLDLEGDKDEIRRAGRINAFLLRIINTCVLFLDDLWDDFRREDVGIPSKCKVVLVTRSFDVCRVLKCEQVLKVEPLSNEESWELFQHNIGYIVLNNNEEVSRMKDLVYEKSGGLPLAIVEVANASTKVVANNVSSLREVLENIDNLKDTFNQLRKSYNRLNNVKIQHCFLYCALYPKGYASSREKLIHFWIEERLIDDVKSLQAQYDMGHSILNKLLKFCLLETCQDEKSVKMHDLIWNMALSIAKDNSMIKVGVHSKF